MDNHSVVKWHEVAQTFAMVDYVRAMIAKNSFKYGKYGSFELCFLLLIVSNNA